MKRLGSTFVVAAAVVVAAGAPAGCDGADSVRSPEAERITADTEVQTPEHLNPRESRLVSFAAARILKHARQAEKLVTEKKYFRAEERVASALRLVQIIEHTMPPTRIATRIESGELVYRDEEVVDREIVVPVSEYLLRVDDLSSGARPESDEQDAAAGAADSTAGEASPTASATDDPTEVVERVEYVDGAVELNIDVARTHLEAAAGALEKDAPNDAQKHLSQIELEGVGMDVVLIDAPFEAVADNLALAEHALEKGHARDAKAALRSASEELATYALVASPARADGITAMRKEIDDLTDEMNAQLAAGHSPTPADSAEHQRKVVHWWNRAWGWIRQLTS